MYSLPFKYLEKTKLSLYTCRKIKIEIILKIYTLELHLFMQLFYFFKYFILLLLYKPSASHLRGASFCFAKKEKKKIFVVMNKTS